MGRSHVMGGWLNFYCPEEETDCSIAKGWVGPKLLCFGIKLTLEEKLQKSSKILKI